MADKINLDDLVRTPGWKAELIAYLQDELGKNRSLAEIAREDFVHSDGRPVKDYTISRRVAEAGYRYKPTGVLVPVIPVEPIRIPGRLRRARAGQRG